MTIDTSLQAVEKLLLSITESSVPLLAEASEHILSAGGKRLRPRLVLLAYKACGGETTDSVVPLAAAVEIVHTATLVHDDINDRGTLRRGRETVNARWGSTFALLTGDFLFTKTYEVMAPYPQEINMILAQAARELVEGETLQIHTAKTGDLTKEIYYEIIAKKTASLFVAATKLGASSANARPEWLEAIADYGYNLGMAFQITDDVLDLVADPEQTGKNTGIDLAQGRGIAAVRSGNNHGNAPSNGQNNPVEIAVKLAQDTMPGLFGNTFLWGRTIKAAAKKGREKAREFADLATNNLNALPPSPARDALHDLTRLVVERDH